MRVPLHARYASIETAATASLRLQASRQLFGQDKVCSSSGDRPQDVEAVVAPKVAARNTLPSGNQARAMRLRRKLCFGESLSQLVNASAGQTRTVSASSTARRMVTRAANFRRFV